MEGIDDRNDGRGFVTANVMRPHGSGDGRMEGCSLQVFLEAGNQALVGGRKIHCRINCGSIVLYCGVNKLQVVGVESLLAKKAHVNIATEDERVQAHLAINGKRFDHIIRVLCESHGFREGSGIVRCGWRSHCNQPQ